MAARTLCTECQCVTFSKANPPKCSTCKKIDHKPSSAYKRGCRCEDCLAYRASCASRWRAKYREENGTDYTVAMRRAGRFPRRRPERSTCGWCGSIHPLNESGTTLDAEGLTHAQWLRHHGTPSNSRELAAPITPMRLTASTPCKHCGGLFTFDALGPTRRYCSNTCRHRNAWMRRVRAHGEFAISTKDRQEVYRRDDWTCLICREPTARDYDPRNPWSPTLDHIEVRSGGGSDFRGNLRTAHAICNSLRGAGVLSDAEVSALVKEGASRVPA